MVHRGEVTQAKLEVIYGVIQRIIKKEECYFTDDEVKLLKSDSKNKFYIKEVDINVKQL